MKTQTKHPLLSNSLKPCLAHETEEVNCISDEVEILKYKGLLITESNHEVMYSAQMLSWDGREGLNKVLLKAAIGKENDSFMYMTRVS